MVLCHAAKPFETFVGPIRRRSERLIVLYGSAPWHGCDAAHLRSSPTSSWLELLSQGHPGLVSHGSPSAWPRMEFFNQCRPRMPSAQGVCDLGDHLFVGK